MPPLIPRWPPSPGPSSQRPLDFSLGSRPLPRDGASALFCTSSQGRAQRGTGSVVWQIELVG